MTEAVVIQFAKWPEPGKVKTRLSPALGDAGACEAHVTLTCHVLRNLLLSGLPVWFYWDRPLQQAPVYARPLLSLMDEHPVRVGYQQGDDLGARMYGALKEGLVEHPKALVVGSDCPSVDADYIRQAIAALAVADVVLGPSDDGGYVLIGACRLDAAMLTDIDWGTAAVLSQTLARLEAAGLRVVCLPPRWDVDEPEDWSRYQLELVQG
ncbi:MAG: TIGR04282 family arsenosugar biosynthesis glycosyltransferase [Marinobacter sp.]|nr:TIGR04282 family arsenosugar biosynthesis glycosyltransferase [Marinobacter sp.]